MFEQRIFGLNMLFIALMNLEEYDRARVVAEESLALSRQYGLDFLLLMALESYSQVLFLPGGGDR